MRRCLNLSSESPFLAVSGSLTLLRFVQTLDFAYFETWPTAKCFGVLTTNDTFHLFGHSHWSLEFTRDRLVDLVAVLLRLH